MKEEIIKILKELLKYNTYEENEDAFNKIFDYIKSIINGNLILKEYVFYNKKAFVVSNYDTCNYDIVFCCHLDVVPISKYIIKEDKDNIYGRGTIDMKGSLAVCLHLMNNLDTRKKIALFITADEEKDGMSVYELLKIYKMKLAIVPDGGRNFDLIREEKGLLQLKLNMITKSAHSSQPFNGENAIIKLMEVYNELIKKYPLPKDSNDYITSINLSKFEGGDKINQVPNYASMYLDIRHVCKDKKEDIIKYIKKINKDVNVIELLSGNYFKTDLKNENIKNYIMVCEKILNKKIKIVGCESTSDAIYFSNLNIPTIIMNPVGYYAHCENEFINKESLEKLYLIYENFLKEMN